MLDWGLGHATRSIPIIRELLNRNHDVRLATSGLAGKLLEKEFPKLQFFDLPSYQAAYSRTIPFMLKIFMQMPRFLSVISKEHGDTARIVRENKIEFIISDSRYGCWSEDVPDVFITHQLNMQMPAALKWLEPVINAFNHRQIRKFSRCWVPDFPENSITSRLTGNPEVPVDFIGMLSRFRNSKSVPAEYDLLALISGPEPQRSIFESMIRKEFGKVSGKKIIVRGLPGLPGTVENHQGFDVVCHLEAKALEELILKSDLIISRSGYSTIMDLAALEKNAIFVPTPGQTEQQLLARELMQRGVAYSVQQENLDLVKALNQAKLYSGFNRPLPGLNLLEEAIDRFIR